MTDSTRPLKQKVIGVLGGCSNVATGEYYRFLNDMANLHFGGWDIAETIIVGMNFGNIEHYVRQNDWDSLQSYMEVKVDGLISAGADIIICVSNTLHKPLEQIMPHKKVEFIHIADPAGDAIKNKSLSRIALFGTKPVMEMDYLRNHYKEKFNLEIVVPTEKEQVEIDRIIFEELVKSSIRSESKKTYLEIADRLVKEQGVEGLILGCTEIFLLIQQSDHPNLPMFNTAKLHCEAAFKLAIA